MKSLLSRIWKAPAGRTLVGVLLGGAAGALYGQYVGCLTGSCPLTSNPWTAGVLGAVLGASLSAPDKRGQQAPGAKAS